MPAAVLLLGIAAAVPPLAAQVHPNYERGLVPDKLYQSGEIDHVNLLTGALTLTIPIGVSYPVNGGLSYGLTLAYTNRGWDTEDYNDGMTTYTQSVPSPRFNAGFGWTLSLGRLYRYDDADNDSGRWMWTTPDGSDHVFFPTLHEDDPDEPGENPQIVTTQAVLYTRDNTFARLKIVNASTREIELASGESHKFDELGRLTQIRDRFGNQVNVAHSSNQWVITDSQMRTQTVFFQNTGLPSYPRVVDKVELTAFGSAPATWDFQYSNQPVDYNCWHTGPGDEITLPLLKAVVLPDGSTYTMEPSDYHLDTQEVCLPGALKGLRTPSLGRIEWTYQTFRYPAQAKPWLSAAEGVATRTLRNADGSVHGTWTYQPQLEVPPPGVRPKQMIHTVTAPLGHRRRHYFSVATQAAAGGWTANDYGLPFTRYQTDTSGTLFLSLEVLEAGASGPVRSSFVRYERDTVGAVPGVLADRQQRNRRMASSRTVFHDDNGTYAEETHSRYDGLGHYRETVTGGTFAAGNVRTARTEYNPARGIYPGSYTALPASAEWILNTYTEAAVTEGSSSFKSEAVFEAATGFRTCTRIWQNAAARGPNDVLVAYSKDAAGNVTTERHSGGDVQALGTGTVCPEPATPAYRVNHTYQGGVLATSQYVGQPYKTVDRTIDVRSGLPSSSRDVAGLPTSYVYDKLGRVTSIRPAEEAWTTISYAAAVPPSNLARVTLTRVPNGGGSTVLAEERYFFDDFGRQREERRLEPDGTSVRRRRFFNALGQVTDQSEFQPLTTTLSSFTQYQLFDPFGRPRRIRPPEGPTHDVLLSYAGVQRVVRTVSIGTGAGAGGSVVETPAATTEIYDRQGRLYQVRDPSNPDGSVATTTYTYDAAHRLVRVQQATASGTQNRYFVYDGRGFLTAEAHPEKGPSGNGTVAYSLFDARGHAGRRIDGPFDLRFLYDAGERLVEVRETGPTGRPLKLFTYGAASVGADRVLGKLQSSTRHNYVDLAPAGQPPQLFTGTLQETYTYAGIEGRVSSRRTELSINGSPTGDVFHQGFTYDTLGNVAELDYPVCQFCPAAVPRSVIFTHSYGRLTAVGGYTGTVAGQPTGVGITYHPSGLLAKVAHAYGASAIVTDEVALDPYYRPRPGQISTTGAVTAWASGVYQWDGASNVTKVGAARFLYDGVSRLKSAEISLAPAGGGTLVQQSYTFDAFGNLTQITGVSGRATPTSASTNRLTGAGVTYDAPGNLTAWNGASYRYDGFGMMWRMTSGGQDWVYLYAADDERLLSYQLGGDQVNRWTLRDLGGQVLREYVVDRDAGFTWAVASDYVYRDGQLLAAETPVGRRRFHLDHLGTPRLITDDARQAVAYHVYWPFGEEATSPTQDAERMKFTGHERDLGGTGGANPAADDLDYMHARYYSPLTGRFLSFDPVGGSAATPQTWNRYGYVLGNPMKHVDRHGLFAGPFVTLLMWANAYLPNEIVTVTAPFPYPQAVSNLYLSRLSFFTVFGAAIEHNGPRLLAAPRNYYQQRLELNLAQGNHLNVLVDRLAVATLPGDTKDLGFEVVIGMAPVGRVMNLAGGTGTVKQLLKAAEKWLGKGYREIAPGVFRSADGKRQFRMTTADLTDPRQGAHVHFESIAADGRTIAENSHVTVADP